MKEAQSGGMRNIKVNLLDMEVEDIFRMTLLNVLFIERNNLAQSQVRRVRDDKNNE
jgi:hypothetical protein